MGCNEDYDYFLIRDAQVLVGIPRVLESTSDSEEPLFFDVRSGVQIPRIHPPLSCTDLERGYAVPPEFAASLIGIGIPSGASPAVDLSKVVSIVDVRQRKLDAIVADSILDQLRVITNVLRNFLAVADESPREERFWLSQQVLPLTRKFSGREIGELQQITEWFRTRRNT